MKLPRDFRELLEEFAREGVEHVELRSTPTEASAALSPRSLSSRQTGQGSFTWFQIPFSHWTAAPPVHAP